MAFNIENFLRGTIGLPTANQAAELPPAPAPGMGTPLEQEILVTGSRDAPSVRGPEAPSMGNTNYQEEAQSALAAAPQRKGLFGTKGTLRDILGVVGDAFLVQSGNKAVYAPRRQQEQLGDAMAGFTEDPVGAMERMAYSGFSEEAGKLQNNVETQRLREAQQQSLDAGRQSVAQGRTDKILGDLQNYGARLLQAAGNDPQKRAYAMQIIEQRAKANNLDMSTLGLNPDMTDDQAAIYAAGDMSVNQQQQIPFTERRVRAAESQAESSRIRAERPPAPRAAPQPTNASIAAPLLEKVQRGGKLTAGEEETLRRTGHSPDKGRPARRGPPPLPPGFQRR